jgi:hypothetical protein
MLVIIRLNSRIHLKLYSFGRLPIKNRSSHRRSKSGQVDSLEAQLHQIKELGYKRYLSMQLEEKQ